MEEILAPVVGFTFEFESFLENELGLFLNEKKKPVIDVCKFYLRGQCRHGSNCQFKHQKAEKSVMCKHWLRGLCKKGENCEFLHEYNLKKMPECWFFSNYGECSNAECMYLHIDPDSKIRECDWYNRGFCKHGPNCRNRHVRKVPCQNYLTGYCPLGPECPRGHARYDLPRYEDHDVVTLPPKTNSRPPPDQLRDQHQSF